MGSINSNSNSSFSEVHSSYDPKNSDARARIGSLGNRTGSWAISKNTYDEDVPGTFPGIVERFKMRFVPGYAKQQRQSVKEDVLRDLLTLLPEDQHEECKKLFSQTLGDKKATVQEFKSFIAKEYATLKSKTSEPSQQGNEKTAGSNLPNAEAKIVSSTSQGKTLGGAAVAFFNPLPTASPVKSESSTKEENAMAVAVETKKSVASFNFFPTGLNPIKGAMKIVGARKANGKSEASNENVPVAVAKPLKQAATVNKAEKRPETEAERLERTRAAVQKNRVDRVMGDPKRM